MRVLVAGLLTLMMAGACYGAEENPCATAAHLVQADHPLPRVAKALATKQLVIAVVGSASSILTGSSNTIKAYPAWLETALSRELPDTAIKVVTRAKARAPAREMLKVFDTLAVEETPNLVIWQTGTVDAMLGVDIDDFRSTLDQGVEMLVAAGADVVLMNMQYSPRTESMIALANYADAMRFIALQREINLFDRFAIMKTWYELGAFDFYTATKKTETAERVHECLGRLLAKLILEAARLAAADGAVPDAPGAGNKDIH